MSPTDARFLCATAPCFRAIGTSYRTAAVFPMRHRSFPVAGSSFRSAREQKKEVIKVVCQPRCAAGRCRTCSLWHFASAPPIVLRRHVLKSPVQKSGMLKLFFAGAFNQTPRPLFPLPHAPAPRNRIHLILFGIPVKSGTRKPQPSAPFFTPKT